VAIMLAGAVFLVQLTTRDELAEPIPVGAATEVGDMTVTVRTADEADGYLTAEVSLAGAHDDGDPTENFRLIASGRALAVGGGTCVPMWDAGVWSLCTIEFDVSGADGTSRVLFYERGEERARWVLG
jgi:hypothetical protein